MAITTTCSGCGKTLAVADEFAGRQARCPACGQIYTVPAPIIPTPFAPPSSAATSGSLDATTTYANPAPLDLESPATTPSTPTAFPDLAPISAPASDNLASNSSSTGELQYWMKASNGAEYGPADAATLNRWFNEGRVGADYMIRIGTHGHWQPKAAFQSVVSAPLTMPATGVNPYAAQSTFTPGVATSRTYPKADQSGLVLAMGILAWIGGCPIFGIIAWVIGAQALADIGSGQADPSSRGVVQVGYYLGMINVILCIACGGLFVLGIVLSAIFS